MPLFSRLNEQIIDSMVDMRRNVYAIHLTAVCNRFNDCTIYIYIMYKYMNKYKKKRGEKAMWKMRAKNWIEIEYVNQHHRWKNEKTIANMCLQVVRLFFLLFSGLARRIELCISLNVWSFEVASRDDALPLSTFVPHRRALWIQTTVWPIPTNTMSDQHSMLDADKIN